MRYCDVVPTTLVISAPFYPVRTPLTLGQLPGDLRQGPALPLQRLYSAQLFQVLLAIAGCPPPDQRRRQQPPCDVKTNGVGRHTRHLGQFDQGERAPSAAIIVSHPRSPLGSMSGRPLRPPRGGRMSL